MSITATAPHFGGHGKISFADHVYPEPGQGQLLLAIRANAICGSDREQYHRGSAIVPGHEAAGTVVSAGPGTATPVGTSGAVFLMDYCGACRSCRLGLTNQCLAKRADMGFTRDGGYGPYEVVHETNFFPVPDDVTPVQATLLLDVMGTGGHALRRARLVHPDIESVYVVGAGPIGLGLLVMAKLVLGADLPVYVSGRSAWRRDYAQGLGGIPVDAADPAAVSAVAAVDLAVDSSGRMAARRAAVDVLDRRGVLVCVGHGEGLMLDVSADLIAPERAVLGSEYFRYDEMPANLDLLRAHGDLLSRVITHTFPVEHIGEAFETFLAGRSGKVVVTQEYPA